MSCCCRWIIITVLALFGSTASGQGGYAFFLDGIDDHIELTLPEAVLFGDWTIEYWYLPASRSGNWVLQGHDCLLDTVLFDSQHWVSWRAFVFQSYDVLVSTPFVLDEENLVSTHFALSHNVNGTRSSFTLWVNGDLFLQVEVPTPVLPAIRMNNLARFTIGRHAAEVNGVVGYERHLEGYIDELRFWNRTLDGEEIKQNMNNAAPADGSSSNSLCCPVFRINGEGSVSNSLAETVIISSKLSPLTARLGGGLSQHVPERVTSPFEMLQGGPLALSLIVGLEVPLDLDLPATYFWVRMQQLPPSIEVINASSAEAFPPNFTSVIPSSLLRIVAREAFQAQTLSLLACETEGACQVADATPTQSGVVSRSVIAQAQANAAPSAGALYEIQFLGDGGFFTLPKLTGTGSVEFWLKIDVFNKNQGIWTTHTSAGGNLWMLFLHGGQRSVYHGFVDWSNQYVRGKFLDGEPLFTADPQHVAITWWTVGQRPDVWCEEWSEQTPCTSSGTPLGWEVWEYAILTYQNGVLLQTDPQYLTSNGTWLFKGRIDDPLNRNTNIGQEWDGDTESDFLEGQVADVRVWDHVRTAEQIAANYQTQLTGLEAGLQYYVQPTADDFAAVPAGGKTEHSPIDLVARSKWEAEAKNQETRDCNMAAREPLGEGLLRCILTLAECTFEQSKGFIVRRSRFPGLRALPLLWRVQETSPKASLPLPRQDSNNLNDFFVSERPDLLPEEVAVQERLTLLVGSAFAKAHVRLAAGSSLGSECGNFSLDGQLVTLSSSAATLLDEGQSLDFQPASLGGGAVSCELTLVYDVTDSSGAAGLAPGVVEVQVLPAAPKLVEVLAVDAKPSNRLGLQAEDELHFVFDKPTNMPSVTSPSELLSLFDVSPPGAVPSSGLFIGCWTGDGRRLMLSLQEPIQSWAGTVNATFALREGVLSGRRGATVSSSAGDNVAVFGGFATRPCSGQGEMMDGMTGRCLQCSAGTRLADDGQLCVPCAAGLTSAVAGSLLCDACPQGNFQDQDGQSACLECEAGRFAAVYGSTGCAACSEGFFAEEVGSSTCQECGIGTFTSELASATCVECSSINNRATGANPSAWVTMKQLVRQGHSPEWIYLSGARNASQCGCDRGYVEFRGECRECGEGLACIGMGEVEVESGYYVAEDSISVFHCFGRTDQCTGGVPGFTCAEGRTSRACADCEDGKAPGSNGKCVDCAGGDLWTAAALAFVFLFVLIFMYRTLSSQKRALQGQSFLLASICFSHICTLAQQLSVISLMNVEFGRPFSDFQEVLKLALFDFNILGLDCLSTTRATGRYNMSLFAVLAALGIVMVIHTVYVGIRRKCAFREQLPVLICVIGTLLLAFYISIVSAILQPFQCFEHPNGKWTPRSYQSVLCFDSSEHRAMVISSAFGMVVPIVFLGSCFWAIHYTPTAVRMGNAWFLRSFGFLLFRFKTSAHKFSLWVLTRALILACAPVIPDVSIQLLLFNVTLLASLFVVGYIRPWRVASADYFEMAVTAALHPVTNLAGMLVNDHNRQRLSTISLLFIVAGFLAVSLGLLTGLVCWFMPGRKQYQFFLSHHKVGSGATARMLKLMLTSMKEVKRKVFYDSDDLMNLDGLFHTVGQQVDNFVLVGSSEVLARPWCLGEMTIARLKKVHSTCVAWPDFTFMTDEDIDTFLESCTELDCLYEYEITTEGIRETLQWVRTFPITKIGGRSATAFAAAARSLVANMPGKVAPTKNEAMPSTSFVITADSRNREAVVTGLVLIQCLHTAVDGVDISQMPSLCVDANAILDVMGQSAKKLVVLCGAGSLSDVCVVGCISYAYVKELVCIPAVVDETFGFPSREDVEGFQAATAQLLPQLVLSELPGVDIIGVSLMVLFKEIAVPFPYKASQSILDLRAREILSRTAIASKRRGIDRASEKASTLLHGSSICSAGTNSVTAGGPGLAASTDDALEVVDESTPEDEAEEPATYVAFTV